MLIKLNPITKIFNSLVHSTVRNNKFIIVRKTSHVIKQEYSFCNRKNQSQDLNNNLKKPDDCEGGKKGPKIIQITKQQYQSMKKFLQDIRYSMPIPNISPPSPSILSKIQQSNQNKSNKSQQLSSKKQQVTPDFVQPYFSSQQHQLSFKLLKLTSTSQFLSPMQQYNQNKNKSIKLLILYRYCSVGGVINLYGNQVEKLGYSFMKQLVDSMNELQENQLIQFLQLYIGIHSERLQQKQQSNQMNLSSLRKSITSELPIYQVQKIQKNPPLIQHPSHMNSRLIVLLIHFWYIQFGKQIQNVKLMKITKPIKQGISQILKHYQLYSEQLGGKNRQKGLQNRQEKDSIEQFPQSWQYSIKDLIYIGIQSFICQREQDRSFHILLKNLKYKASVLQNVDENTMIDQKIKHNALQIIRLCQYLLQNLYRLTDINEIKIKVKQNINLLSSQIIKVIQKISFISLNFKQTENQSDNSQQDLNNSVFSNRISSSSVSSLLYHSLLCLQTNPISTQSIYFASNIFSIILKKLSTANVPTLTLLQYSQCWQSCMVMYKLIKAQHQKIKPNDIDKLANSFMTKIDLDVWLKLAEDQQEGGKVIEEYIRDNQRFIFQCLVGYRMVLVPDLDKNQTFTQNSPQLQNIKCQIISRNMLRNLIVSYRKTQQLLYKCNLISDAKSTQIHNLIIILMISQAYISSQNSQKQIKKFSQYLLTPVVSQILTQYGVSHAKYGQYVTKILQKYQII